MTELDPGVDSLRHIEQRLFELQKGQIAINRRIPGPLRIGCGVMLGMVFFAVLGVVATVVFWSVIIGAVAGAAGGASAAAQGAPGATPGQVAPR